jgi:amino acid transporter
MPPLPPNPSSDENRLHRLGYAQELRRTLGFFASFGIAFCYVSPVVGVYTLFGYGLATGGPAFVWGLPLVVGGQLLVVLVFSEVAASYPLAGALYQWARRLVGPRYGWFVGWIYGWALIVTIAAVDFGAAPYLASLLGLEPRRTTLVLLAAGLLAAHSAFNYAGVRGTTLVTSAGVAVEVIATVAIAGAIFATGVHHPWSVLLTTEPAGSPYLPPFLASTLAMAWIFYGFESAADVAEEVVDPARHVPRAMIASLLGAAIVTVVVVVALILGSRDLGAAAADPARTIPLILGEHFGAVGSALLLLLIVFAYFSCAAAVQTAAARLVYSYARDGGLPGASWLRRISPGHKVPANAILFTALVGVLATAATYVEVAAVNANALLVSYAVVGIYLSFQAVVLARLVAGARGWRPDGDFSLGAWGTPVALAALAYGLAMIVNLCWPRPADAVAGWLTLAAALLILVPGALLARRSGDRNQ